MEFVFATNNAHKMAEIRRMTSAAPFSVLSMGEAGFDFDICEDGKTFEENAAIKAVAVCRETGRPALADDSGLEIDFLDGAPGILSARFLGKNTPQSTKNAQILEMLNGAKQREAQFVCVIAAAFPDVFSNTNEPRVLLERGVLKGIIADKISGSGGFGYDPIFYLPELGKTVAELRNDEKDLLSHRGKAMAAMISRLQGELKSVENSGSE